MITIGTKLKSENGYIWIVTGMKGKKFIVESEDLIEVLSASDINALIQTGLYTIIF